MSARPQNSDGPAGARRQFDVAHLRFELLDQGSEGVTFSLRPAQGPADQRRLFAGHIERGMGAALIRFGQAVQELEAGIE